MDLIFMTCKVNDFRLSFVLISDDLYVLFFLFFCLRSVKKQYRNGGNQLVALLRLY